MCVCGCDNKINKPSRPDGPARARERSKRLDGASETPHRTEREDKQKTKKPSVSADSQLVPKPVLMRPKQA